MAYNHGAYTLALHVGQNEITVIDSRINGRNDSVNPKKWSLGQIAEAIAYYEILMTKHSKSPKFILVCSASRDRIPESLEVTLYEAEQQKKQEPETPTPKEQWEALFKK